MKWFVASEGVVNELLHPLGVASADHLAIHLQLGLLDVLLLLPQLEQSLLVLLAEMHSVVPHLLRRRSSCQRHHALHESLLLEPHMAQQVYYYLVVRNHRGCVS